MADEFDDLPGVDDPEDFLSAVDAMLDYLQGKVMMPAEDFYALQDAAKLRAFTVSGVTDLDLMSDVWNAIDSAVREGDSLEEFRERVAEKLESEWGGENPSRLDTIFRTNVQTAYSAGRFHENNSPAVRETHPYSRYDVVDDSRTSDICEDLIGTVLPSDHPFVLSHQPPLHHNCRTDVVAITEAEARDLGVDEEAPDVQADDGFGDPFAEFTPDLSTRPPELASIFELKVLAES